MTDTAGTAQATYEFDPFGRVSKLQGSLDSPFQYATYYSHSRSALSFTLYRAYDPLKARWLSRDPLYNKFAVTERVSGPNLYAYCFNNPINFYDPLGLTKCCENAPPEPSDSPACQSYGGPSGTTFLGASETCVCRCMGDSAWAQKIRGCLQCEASHGTGVWARHGICYLAASSSDPVGAGFGIIKVMGCGTWCSGGSSAW
jgi:RHS repeat-associated protein